MAASHSAGVVLYRRGRSGVEIMLVHPGGPFWANKDAHGWSIPKGEFDPDAEPGLGAALREFEEELGRPAPLESEEEAFALASFRAGRKTIHAWMIEGDFDSSQVESNMVEIEWPPRSGRRQMIPEVDRAEWFSLPDARLRLHKGQAGLVDLIEAEFSGRQDQD